MVYADLYGQSEREVVLAHDGQFSKESWAQQVHTLPDAGFRVPSFDFRGHGESREPQGESGGEIQEAVEDAKSRAVSSRILCEQMLSLRNEPAGTYVTRFCGLLSPSAPGCEFAKPDAVIISDELIEETPILCGRYWTSGSKMSESVRGQAEAW